MLHCQPQPGSRHLGIFSACQGSSRRPHQQQQDTAHSSTLAPAHRLLSPPPSPPGTCSQHLQVVTGHPCPGPGCTGQAQHSPATSSSQHGTAACCCSLVTASPPGWCPPPPAPCRWWRPPVPCTWLCALCTPAAVTVPCCADKAELCRAGLPRHSAAAHSRAAVIIPPTPGPHFYTSQHRNISHSALWHYSTA